MPLARVAGLAAGAGPVQSVQHLPHRAPLRPLRVVGRQIPVPPNHICSVLDRLGWLSSLGSTAGTSTPSTSASPCSGFPGTLRPTRTASPCGAGPLQAIESAIPPSLLCPCLYPPNRSTWGYNGLRLGMRARPYTFRRGPSHKLTKTPSGSARTPPKVCPTASTTSCSEWGRRPACRRWHTSCWIPSPFATCGVCPPMLKLSSPFAQDDIDANAWKLMFPAPSPHLPPSPTSAQNEAMDAMPGCVPLQRTLQVYISPARGSSWGQAYVLMGSVHGYAAPCPTALGRLQDEWPLGRRAGFAVRGRLHRSWVSSKH